MRVALLAVSLLLLAGCAGNPSPSNGTEPEDQTVPAQAEAGEASPPPSPQAEPPMGPVQALASCELSCFEPTIATYGNDTYVTAVRGTDIAVSHDGGRTFTETVHPPRRDLGAGPTTWNDAMVHVDASGSLYFSGLVIQRIAGGLASAFVGIQVARSDDGGRTWASDVLLAPGHDESGGALNPDRQWLAFGPGDVVYVSYKQIPGGVLVARSEDRGATFSPFVPAVTVTGGSMLLVAGAPVVPTDQDVLIPFTSPAVATGGGADGGLAVAVSRDRGMTFATVLVERGQPSGYFPSLAVDGDAVAAAWTTLAGDLRVAVSADLGSSWSASTDWNGDDLAETSWVLAGEGRTHLVWHRRAAGGTDVVVTSGTGAGPEASVVLEAGSPAGGAQAQAKPANSDFAHGALQQGTVQAVWSRASESVWVGRT